MISEKQRQRDHRDDDDEHQPGGDEDQVTLLHRNIARWRHHDPVASTDQQRGQQGCCA